MLKWTTKGRIEVRRNGELVSRHILDREAWESVANHAAIHGPGKYVVTYPNVEVDVMAVTIISTDTQAPTQPGVFAVTAPGTGGLRLTWTPSTDGPPGPSGGSGLRGYRVFRANVPAGPFAQIALVEHDQPNDYTDLSVPQGASRSYYIDAIDNAGNVSTPTAVGTATAADTTPPTAPSINATALSTTSVEIALVVPATDSGSGVSGYDLEFKRSVDSTWTVHVTNLAPGSFPRVISGLTAATGYDFRPRARDAVGNIGPYGSVVQATTQSGAGGPVAAAMTVEYVDGSGNFQSIQVEPNGSTVISGIAPFLVHFDATASRGNLSNNNTLAGAFYNLGYRLNYGENRGTSWTYGKAPYLSRDEDFGPPIFGHVYEAPGSRQTRLRVRDTNGAESTISLTVNVAAPPAATIIETSAGGWPTWVSGTHYQLRAGADYTSFGTMNLRRVHNVLISKVGAGADPIVSEAYFGNESAADLDVTRERTRHVRLLDIAVTTARTGNYGPLHCGIVNGRVRRVAQDNLAAFYQNNSSNATQRAQIRHPRGWFMYNSGLTDLAASNLDYLMIEQRWLNWHMKGCRLQHPESGSGNHILRVTQHRSTARNCQIFTTTSGRTSRIKMQAESNGSVPGIEPWNYGDLVGPVAGPGSAWYRYSNSFNAYQSIQFGGPGDIPPNATTFSSAPQNGVSGEPTELHEYNTLEDCQDTRPAASAVRGGRHLGARGLRNPDGSPWLLSEIDFGLARIPLDARGPYITEVDNTRPIPSAF